jgi:hypothetical protein
LEEQRKEIGASHVFPKMEKVMHSFALQRTELEVPFANEISEDAATATPNAWTANNCGKLG